MHAAGDAIVWREKVCEDLKPATKLEDTKVDLSFFSGSIIIVPLNSTSTMATANCALLQTFI